MWRISQFNVGASCNSELVFLLQLPTQIYIWEGLQTEALDKCFQVVAVVVLVILVVLAVFKALPKSGCHWCSRAVTNIILNSPEL